MEIRFNVSNTGKTLNVVFENASQFEFFSTDKKDIEHLIDFVEKEKFALKGCKWSIIAGTCDKQGYSTGDFDATFIDEKGEQVGWGYGHGDGVMIDQVLGVFIDYKPIQGRYYFEEN